MKKMMEDDLKNVYKDRPGLRIRAVARSAIKAKRANHAAISCVWDFLKL